MRARKRQTAGRAARRHAVVMATALGVMSPLAGEAFAAKNNGAPKRATAPIACAANTVAPTCVYRVDSRPPSQVFADGFKVPGAGTNNNLLDHINGRSTMQANGPLKGTTNFVSTSTGTEYVTNYAGRLKLDLKATGGEGWIYVVQPDHTFHNVRTSLERAAKSKSPEIANAAKQTLKYYGYQAEWAARGSIRPELVQHAVPVKMVNGLPEPDWERLQTNSGYRPGDAKSANPAPYEIAGASELCAPGGGAGRVRRSAEACDIGVRDHAEVARKHQERLRAHGDDVEYVTTLDEFEKNPKSLLSPLRETNGVLNDAAAAELGAKDFEAFSTRVTEALGRDLRAVHGLSTDTTLLAKVARQAGRAAELGAKALPYVGIAATGYAIAEDVKAGDYANLAFDSVAEGLQVAMVAQPELVPLLEPVLFAEQLAQIVYDEIAGWFKRQEQLDHDRKQWDSAAEDLVEHRDGQWRDHLVGQALQKLFPQLNEKFNRVLTSDVKTLKKWADAKKTAVAQIAGRSKARAASAEEKQRIEKHETALKKKINAKVWEQQDARTKVYEEQIAKVATGAFAATLKPGKDGKDGKDGKAAFDVFTDHFVEKSAKPYLDKLIDKISMDEYRAAGSPTWDQRELTSRQARWKQMTEDKLAEVRRALSREGRTALSEKDVRDLQRENFPAREAFRDPERDRDRLFDELARDSRSRRN
ncbi:hypothetical protein I5Q34_17385 [Streptomyces sp. AV19]|uniref:hypothetical protein n=1 Tax=Streptomyces sp. AV19 TaxID=2793068 RepID=UPI0018FE3E2D|nr:hypothetical protein [Streptomyces sp. AV19]MBH1936020.1 hypothetical protein [Streptomyces sp. AV19]MDG4534188.1 hypothetical protein [Streptomyces sp. AV19]